MEYELIRKMRLKDLVIRRVAVLFCSQTKMYKCIVNINSLARNKQEHQVAIDEVSKYFVADLSLPVTTKEELLMIMQPVSREIIKWLNFHERFLEPYNINVCDLEVLEHMRWTCLGTVDYPETAKALIKHEMLGVTQLYKLACLYCFEADIQELWEKMPARSKERFYDRACPLNVKQPEIVIIWTYTIKGLIGELDNFLREKGSRHSNMRQFIFEYVAVRGYRTATEHFFESLSSKERKKMLVKTALSVAEEFAYPYRTNEFEQHSDILYYLMTEMNDKQTQELIETYPCELLRCTLDWPRQELFLKYAEYMFPYLLEKDVCRVLSILSRNKPKRYNNSKMFRDLFEIIPKQLKSYSLKRHGHFLGDFFRIGDVETIKFIFRHMEAAEIKLYVFAFPGMYNCYQLVKEGKWDLLRLFIIESKLSMEDREKLVKSFVSRSELLLDKEELQRFTKFVSEIEEVASHQQPAADEELEEMPRLEGTEKFTRSVKLRERQEKERMEGGE